MEQFKLPVTYKGEEKLFTASLQVTGYTHKFIVDVNGQNVTFEPEEEGSYRALLNYKDIATAKNIDRELMKAISDSIRELLR